MSTNNDIRGLEKIIATFLNKQLQQICSAHGLKTSGVKADLQARIKNALYENYSSDPILFNSIRNTIYSITGGAPSQQSMAPPLGSGGQSHNSVRNNFYSYGTYNSGSSVPSLNQGYGNGSGVSGGAGYSGSSSRAPDSLFKNTPFYNVETRIGNLHTCAVMSNHRNSVTITLKASEFPELNRCTTDSSIKLMVFCGIESVGPQDIQFPHQSELKVNSNDVKHNLRGLKNKSGSTLPVDITPFLRLKQSNYANTVEFTYALTTKKYFLALYLCKKHSIDDLVKKVMGKKIFKASVVRDISKKANDPDVVATSQVLSLKCPLSCTRLNVPCRGISCTHIQCFDANFFLQLQEQGPTWSCPICDKPTPFETLAIDEYVMEVLLNTPDSLEQVTIEPDGQWRVKTEEPELRRSGPPVGTRIEDDDDLSILSDSYGLTNGAVGGPVNGRNALSTPSRSMLSSGLSSGTPNGGSRATPSTQRSGSHKRPAEVIDLTLSSDEDDEPIVRPPKRQNVGTPNILFPPAFGSY